MHMYEEANVETGWREFWTDKAVYDQKPVRGFRVAKARFQHAFFATPGVAMRGMMASVASVDDIAHCEHNHIICISLLV